MEDQRCSFPVEATVSWPAGIPAPLHIYIKEPHVFVREYIYSVRSRFCICLSKWITIHAFYMPFLCFIFTNKQMRFLYSKPFWKEIRRKSVPWTPYTSMTSKVQKLKPSKPPIFRRNPRRSRELKPTKPPIFRRIPRRSRELGGYLNDKLKWI